MSLIVTIMASVELFYGYTKQIEQANEKQKEAYILGCDIFKYLSLDATNRVVDERMFLTECYSRYIKMIESSQQQKRSMDDKLLEIEYHKDLKKQNQAMPRRLSNSSLPSITTDIETSSDGSMDDSGEMRVYSP